MTPETKQALRDVLGITEVSQVTPRLIQLLQDAARELLSAPAQADPSSARPKR